LSRWLFNLYYIPKLRVSLFFSSHFHVLPQPLVKANRANKISEGKRLAVAASYKVELKKMKLNQA